MPPTVELFSSRRRDCCHNFKRNSISTINSALFFNGTVSQVRKGNPWIKMHPDFKRYLSSSPRQHFPNIKQNEIKAVSSEIVPKVKQSMGYMDLPSNPF